MRIVGIIAEYDPFHRGHLRHLEMARQAAQADLVYIALSGCLRQRGDLALLSPWERAACAAACGADAVFELPLRWTVREAENYALGAVSMLSRLGCTHLAFGAECSDLSLLRRLADHLEENAPALQHALKTRLSEGVGYPAALSAAADETLPEAAGMLKEPNNILAVCYLRAIRRLRSVMTPVCIPRSGSYHAHQVDPASPSASAIRAAVLRGDYQGAFAALPDPSIRTLRRRLLDHALPDSAVADALLLARLRDPACQKKLRPCLSEGLEAALIGSASRVDTRAALLQEVTSRRYASARIRRLCACALLGWTEAALRTAPLPEAAALLAFRRNPAMTGRWKELPVRVLSSPGEWREAADYQDNLAAYRLWSQCCHQPDTLPFSVKMTVL